MSENDTQKHLYELLKDFSTAMLVSRDGDGHLHARPMAVADLRPDADAYFATSVESPKVAEIQNIPDVMISFQGKSQFATVTGVASIVRDRALIEKLWSEAWRVWFPGGKTDPNLVLIKVDAREGEYWDNSGLSGLRYAFEGLKAVVKGERPQTDKDNHAKLRLVSG